MSRATIWIFADSARRADDFGRIRAPSGRRAFTRAAALSECFSGGRPCTITRGPRGNSWCARCGGAWSVTHSGDTVLVARARSPIGIDAEVPRSRPAAFRFLTRVTGASIVSIEQWTQAEALWKAAGHAHRRPRPGELVLPESCTTGWNTTTDELWTVLTQREPALAWSCALPNDDDHEVEVRDRRDDTERSRDPTPTLRSRVESENAAAGAAKRRPRQP